MVKLIALLLVLLAPSSAFAASSSVTVNNEANTSNSNSGQNEVNVNTNIRIETNGEVTTYSSTEPQDIDIKVINGESEIKVDGKIMEEEKISTISPTLNPDSMEPIQQDKNIFELFEDIFKSIFSLLV